jgi:hypothetical protein
MESMESMESIESIVRLHERVVVDQDDANRLGG